MAMNFNFGDRFFASRASLQMHASKRNGKTYKWSKLYLDTFFLLSLMTSFMFFFLSSSRFFIFSLFLLFISMDDCSLESKIKKNKTKKKSEEYWWLMVDLINGTTDFLSVCSQFHFYVWFVDYFSSSSLNISRVAVYCESFLFGSQQPDISN